MNNIERVTGRKINIEVIDTINAIDRMGKNKAAAADELLDIIFQVKEWKKMGNILKHKEQLRKNWKTETFTSEIDHKME